MRGKHSAGSFVVRAVRDRRGEISGIVEHVATGAKEAFTSAEAIGRAIAQMLRSDDAPARRARDPCE